MNTDGLYDGTEFGDKTFYGFRMDPLTGRTIVEIIDDDTMVIQYPNPDVVDLNETLHFLWSRNAIDFRWGPDGHLHMVFL